MPWKLRRNPKRSCARRQSGHHPDRRGRSAYAADARRTFAQEHYSTVIAGDGQSGLEMFRSEHPLAVVLDLILPNISGRELCRPSSSFRARHR